MGGGISKMAKQELVATIRDRYRQSSKKDKRRILDEFTAITGHHRKYGIGCGVGRSTAAVTMGEGSRAPLLIGCQDAPGVARADSHQFSRLVQGNVLREEAVQDLKSGLFFLSQSHILHGVNVTFLLAS